MVLSVLASQPTWAQTASQITPPSFAPPQAAPQAPVAIAKDSGSIAPEGAERTEVTLGDLVIEGGDVGPDRLAELKARLVGKPIKVAEIFAAARAIETDYARSGRVLTRVVVPAQPLDTGATLRLMVVEGMIERVDTTSLPGSVRARIAALLSPLVGRRDISQTEIERRLMLASDVPGVTLRSTLAAGDAAGATVLVVQAGYRPVTGFLTVDNTLPEALGRVGYGLGLNFNSVLGAGELIYLRASGLPTLGRETSFLDPTPRNRALAGGVIVPLGDDGLSLNVEVTDARTAPRHEAGFPGVGSRFRRMSNRLRYPVIRSRALTVSAEAALDIQNERTSIIDPALLPLSFDKLRIARAAGEVSAYLAGGGIATGRIEASFGLDALGARSAADASALLPLSRAGSDASFQKLEIGGSLDQPLAQHLTLSVRARAQTSFGQAMANAEQFGIATQDAISSLPSGAIQGDAGYVARTELGAPFVVGLSDGAFQLTPYGFGAVGGVRVEQPTFFERRETSVYAYGAGLRLAGSHASGTPGVSARVEYGRTHRDGFQGETDRVIFTTIAQF